MAFDGCSPKAVRLASMILYCASGVIEFISFICLIAYIPSICVTAHENSTRIWWSLNCIFPQILPDFAFAVVGFFFVKLFYAPIGGAYNIFMASLSILSAIFAFVSVTGCGNPSEPLATVAGIFGLIAGGLHIAITTVVAINLEEEDKLFEKSDHDD